MTAGARLRSSPARTHGSARSGMLAVSTGPSRRYPCRRTLKADEPLPRPADDARQRRLGQGPPDRVVPRLPAPGRARPGRNGGTLRRRDERPRLAPAACLRPVRQPAGRFRLHWRATLMPVVLNAPGRAGRPTRCHRIASMSLARPGRYGSAASGATGSRSAAMVRVTRSSPAIAPGFCSSPGC
jgi:hypothetical protein